jgi:tetratricopeptide (TPR) repeat protein
VVPVKEIRLSTLVWVRGDSKAFAELADLKSTYIKNGREWDAARIAVELSAGFIRRADYRSAATEAVFARDIFEKHHDNYGSTIAKMNLLSALSGLPGEEDGVNKLVQELSDDTANQPRRRAALCNVLARKARENNDVAASKAYAKEAIEIGRALGDVSVICINQGVLGNAFKQEGDLDGALEHYRLADKTAREAGLTHLEGWIQWLIASVLNRKGDGNLAIHHARYAIGLVKDGVSWRTEAEAYEELAYGCEQIRDWLAARDAWLRVAELKLRQLEEQNEGFSAFLRAARFIQQDNAREAYIDAYQRLFKGNFVSDPRLSSREKLLMDMSTILAVVREQFAFEAAVYHGRLVFDGLPQIVARQFYLRLLNEITNQRGKRLNTKTLALAALALSMVVPAESLSIGDLAQLSKHLAERIPALSFRAHHDGAAHWALKIHVSKPIIITISQLDDRRDVTLVSLCLALMLLAFVEELEADVLAGAEPSRSEASIQIVEFGEAKRHGVPLENVGLEKMDQECVVSRAADPKHDPKLPIVVITRDDITSTWFVGQGRSNAGQVLFAKALVELVYHLFAGEIELESLYPKVVELVKKTVV